MSTKPKSPAPPGPGYDYKDLARRIDKILVDQGRKRSALARDLGKTDSWISQVMSGKIALSHLGFLEIATALGVSPAALLPGSELHEKVAGAGAAAPLFFGLEEYIRRVAREEFDLMFVEKILPLISPVS